MRTKAPVHIGTSGWHYGHWRGPFYPDNLGADRFLTYYAARFPTVEINNSFYRLPSERALTTWRDTAPPGCIFAVKASRFITHMKKLKDPERSLAPFLERIALLGEKLGPILFQLPPRWHFDAARLAGFGNDLGLFLVLPGVQQAMRQAGGIEHFERADVGPALDPAGAEDQRQSRTAVCGG